MTEIDDDNLNSDGEGDLRANIKIDAGESVVVYVAADLDPSSATNHPISDNDGLNISLNVVNVTTDGADVTGDDVDGASHEINEHINVDTFKTTLSDGDSTAKIGENNVEFATITVKAEDTDMKVTSMKLKRDGTAGDDSISDVTLKVNGEEFSAIADNDEYTFDFGTGISIDENDDEDFVLTADIEDDATKTVIFTVEDVVAMDNGVFLTNTISGSSTLTIENSQIVISKTNDVEDEDVAAGASDVAMASFDVDVDGEDITGDMEVVVKVTATTGDSSDLDLNNLAIYKGSSKVSDLEDASFSSLTGTTTVTFDDVTFMDKGDAVDYTIKADISSDAPNGTKYEIVSVKLVSAETESGDDVADVTENIAVEQKVEGAVLEAKVKNVSPAEFAADTDDQEVAKIELDANDSGDDMKVTKIVLAAAGTIDLGEVKKCELFNGTDSVSNKEDADGSMKFDDMDLTVKAGEKVTLTVKCDIGDAVTADETLTFNGTSLKSEGVTTNTDVDLDDTAFAEDTSAKVVLATLEVKADPDTPDAQVVLEDASDVVLGSFKVKANDGDVNLESVKITLADSAALDGDIDIYVDGSKLSGKSEAAAATVEFTNLSEKVNADDTVVVEFRADVKATAAGDATDVVVLEVTEVKYDDGVNNTDQSATVPTNLAIENVTVKAAVPVVTQKTTGSSNTLTFNTSYESDQNILAFGIKADGNDLVVNAVKLNTNLAAGVLKNAEVKVYSDSALSNEEETSQLVVSVPTGEQVYALPSPVTISDGDTYYFVLEADVNSGTSTGGKVELKDANTAVVFTPGFDISTVLDDDITATVNVNL